jgi:hypothetical protein
VNHQPPAPGEGEVTAVTQRWVYGGLRVLNDKRVHAWLDPTGRELPVRAQRGGGWAIGGYYTARVVRDGEATKLAGTPSYTGDGDARDELRRELWAKDTAARTRLARLAQERRHARRNAIDEALQPLLAAARTLKTSADRDALIAYVMRQLIRTWYTPDAVD